ncbi:MAG: dTDP-glucose 4,6-dehydratase [Flavobacteriaceae bacterium]|nr:dTDP-glucose 4,6-dehydratase [Flavobacteriaceae bacterium]MBL6685087.1 dTDP-glucose 4,6-dehydratase [Flavobacteriaceae bacterium]
MKNILITGGAGFIGSHLVKYFVKKYKNYNIINLDKLTYASNISFLNEIKNFENYFFVEADICDLKEIEEIFSKYKISNVIHLAAESHVDNSIENTLEFAKTNVLGTINLLELSRKNWKKKENNLFYHISTDEVFGTLDEFGIFSENSKYDPHSPYSASKASADHFVRAFYDTHKLPIIVSNCSNNYGPNQHTEKLIPTVINSLIKKTKIPIYGNGLNIRDWLYVEDHIEAIDLIFNKGIIGETYCIGGENEIKNIDLIKMIIKEYDLIQQNKNSSIDLISFVEDRLGHDFRYAIDISKIKYELGWKPKTSIGLGLKKTINWYLNG